MKKARGFTFSSWLSEREYRHNGSLAQWGEKHSCVGGRIVHVRSQVFVMYLIYDVLLNLIN